MMSESGTVIKNIVTALLDHMGFVAATVEVKEGAGENSYVCEVSIVDGQNFLIGQYGMNLAALQHLTRILARKEVGEKLDIIVDVNNYFAEKKQLLEKEAKQALEEALQKNVSVSLRPMLSYERKIVHAFLSNNESVMTESAGFGEERRVTVRPKPLSE